MKTFVDLIYEQNVFVRETAPRRLQGPVGTGVGALVGAFIGACIGLLGGPVGGTIGFGAGALLGSVRDLYDLGVDEDFVNEVSQKRAPGKTGLIAEVSEEWIAPLDTRMEAIGGTVVREWRDDFIHDRSQRRIDALKADLARRKTVGFLKSSKPLANPLLRTGRISFLGISPVPTLQILKVSPASFHTVASDRIHLDILTINRTLSSDSSSSKFKFSSQGEGTGREATR